MSKRKLPMQTGLWLTHIFLSKSSKNAFKIVHFPKRPQKNKFGEKCTKDGDTIKCEPHISSASVKKGILNKPLLQSPPLIYIINHKLYSSQDSREK